MNKLCYVDCGKPLHLCDCRNMNYSSSSLVSAQDIVDYARTWVGTRWVHQGRSEHGIDCVGLLAIIANHFELPGEDLTGYRRQPGSEFMGHIRRYSNRVPNRLPINGSIGIFHDTVMPCHAGVFAVCPDTGRITVIHADAGRRRCVEEDYNESSPSLKSRISDVRMFQEVEYVI